MPAIAALQRVLIVLGIAIVAGSVAIAIAATVLGDGASRDEPRRGEPHREGLGQCTEHIQRTEVIERTCVRTGS